MESVTRPILDLMYQVLNNKGDKPVIFSEIATIEQIKLCAQLIESKYLDGTYVRNENGIPCNAVVFDVTLAGREYMDHLETQIKEQSLAGKARALSKKAFWAAVGGGGIGGAILTLLTQYLTKKLGL